MVIGGSWSPNGSTVSETQIQIEEDLPREKEEIDSQHAMCLAPDNSSDITDHGLDPVLNDHSTANSVNHLDNKETTMISTDIVPLILSDLVRNSNCQNSFSQVEDWILAEHSEFVEERQITGKLKTTDIGESPPYLSYQEDEMRKTQRKLQKSNRMSVFVQEKDVNLDLVNCNRAPDSLSSEWLVSSHSSLFRCSSKSPISDRMDLYEVSSGSYRKKYSNGRVPGAERHRDLLNPEPVTKEHPKQKSLSVSKFPLCVRNQSSPSNRLRHIDSNISRYTPSSSGRSSVSHHSQLAKSTISTVQRRRWRNVRPNDLDDQDNKMLHYVLDNALRTAKNLQRTSERMVQRLAADLVYRSSYSM